MQASATGRPTRLVEAPLIPAGIQTFTRTVAPLYDRSAVIALTVSGFTVLPWNYDAAVAPPQISSVVNAADGKPGVAPGGLISVYGQQMSATLALRAPGSRRALEPSTAVRNCLGRISRASYESF